MKKLIFALLMISLGFGLSVLQRAIFFREEPERRIAVAGNVHDLIDRLYPLSKCASAGYCYRSGLAIVFTKSDVTVDLEMIDRKYSVTARSLGAALGSMTDPDPRLQEAVRDWLPQVSK